MIKNCICFFPGKALNTLVWAGKYGISIGASRILDEASEL